MFSHELDIMAHMDIVLQRFDVLEKENSHLEMCLKVKTSLFAILISFYLCN